MRSLVLGEWDGDAIADATLRVVTAAKQRGMAVDMLVHSSEAAEAASLIAGIERILLVDCVAINEISAESLASQIIAVADQYSLIAASHRTLGRSALPRAAAMADCAFIADVINVNAANTYVRGLYAGSVVATVESSSSITFATFRASSFSPATREGGTAETVRLPPTALFEGTSLIERQASEGNGRELTNADIVVSGGRGLASKENMDKLGTLAEKIGAALGASRAAVDAGYAVNAAQVGQTGKTVAPDIYLAFGISGAIQHLAGMKDSRVIVAVNKDPDAPIFAVADYGIVGDLFAVMAELDTYATTSGTTS